MDIEQVPALLTICSLPGTHDYDDTKELSHISQDPIFVSLFDEIEENEDFDETSKCDFKFTKLPNYILEGNPVDADPCHKHILTEPLMESLRNYLPTTIMEQNYWLKYSLLRDGASFYNMLQRLKGSNRTIITIETMEGEIFGSFTSNIWKNGPNFYGSGESFLWRKKRGGNDEDVEVFPFTNNNYFIQICTEDLIGLGGGDNTLQNNNFTSNNNSCAGFGLAIDSDLTRGASVPCATFNNPSLVQSSNDGIFEVYNIEVWTLTRCTQITDAQELESHKLFLGSIQ